MIKRDFGKVNEKGMPSHWEDCLIKQLEWLIENGTSVQKQIATRFLHRKMNESERKANQE